MFVALPFSYFLCVVLYYLAYTTRALGSLPDRFTCPLLWVARLSPDLLAGALYRMRFGVLSPAGGGFALSLLGLPPALSEKRGLTGDVKYPLPLGAWYCWETPLLAGFPVAMLACGRFGVALLVRGNGINKPATFWAMAGGGVGFITGWKVFFQTANRSPYSVIADTLCIPSLAIKFSSVLPVDVAFLVGKCARISIIISRLT